MKQENFDRLDSFAMMQLISARNMASKIENSLSENKISRYTALELLDGVKELMANAYNQRIELFMSMKMNTRALESSKRDELKSLDDAYYSLPRR